MTPDEAEGFYEDDEDPAKVLAAFEAGPHGRTACPVVITYDPEADAAYVYLGRMTTSARTQELTESVMVDYDDSGRLVGIELLDVQRPYVATGDEDAEKRLIARRITKQINADPDEAARLRLARQQARHGLTTPRGSDTDG